MELTGCEIFLEVLRQAGVRYLFGNPGSTELPLLDALARQSEIQYVLGLAEIPVVSMADGYAQATGQPAVVNLHISCGLGNAMGMVYNAWRACSPVVITAGQQDQRLIPYEPVLWAELVSVVRPWTRWAAEAHTIEDMAVLTRRALQEAMIPPRGPVFLALPLDLQVQRKAVTIEPVQHVDWRLRPPREAIEHATHLLRQARHPVIVAGSRVAESGAYQELEQLAEEVGAPVFTEPVPSHGRCGFRPTHPLAAGILPMWSPEIRAKLEPFDLVLFVGLDVMVLYIYREPNRPLPETARLIHIDSDPRQLGKNYAADVAILGNLRTTLSELGQAWRARATEDERACAARRRQNWEAQLLEVRGQLREQAARAFEAGKLEPLAVMEAVRRVLPDEGVLVLEATSVQGTYLEQGGWLKNPALYFGHRGWALGWGAGFAIGVKLAWPERPVLAILGDGAALYGVQALWTTAHYRIPVVWLVANNREYTILKTCANVMGLRDILACSDALEIRNPEIDFVRLAQGFGVEALRPANVRELEEMLTWAWSSDQPVLLDVALPAVWDR